MVQESAFRGIIGFLDKIGVYDVILPFLLVFTIVFAILEKTKVLGLDKIDGKEFSTDLEGYEIEITGTSDKSGFTGMLNIDGPNLHRALLGYGKGMHKKPKGEKKKNKRPNGLRLRKTVRGKEISLETIQINTKVLKEGSKKFEALFEAPAEEAKE